MLTRRSCLQAWLWQNFLAQEPDEASAQVERLVLETQPCALPCPAPPDAGARNAARIHSSKRSDCADGCAATPPAINYHGCQWRLTLGGPLPTAKPRLWQATLKCWNPGGAPGRMRQARLT